MPIIFSPSPPPPSTSPPLSRARIRTRRKRYLDATPSYFTHPSLSLSLATPYERLVARYMTAVQREDAGKKRSFGDLLERGLECAENRMERVRRQEDVLNEEPEEALEDAAEPETKEEAWILWQALVEKRFVAGQDGDFDYASVDENDEWDDRDEEDRNKLEKWLDGEDPRWERTPQAETGIQDF
jgi:hypothetical protein